MVPGQKDPSFSGQAIVISSLVINPVKVLVRISPTNKLKSEVIATSYEVIEKTIFAFDCVYNRESIENKASYFKNSKELISILNNSPEKLTSGSDMLEIERRLYTWATIARQYESLY